MKKRQPEEQRSERIYEKPVLRVIELAAEEIMGGCKVAGGAGLISTPCQNCSTVTAS